MTASAPFLFILKNGPIYSIDDYIGYQLEVLSERFTGELWATSSENICATVGRFKVNLVKQPESNTGFFYLAYYKQVLRRARELDRTVAGPKLVLTYDPFRNGLLGLLVKRRCGWPLIVEINGCFGNPDTFSDGRGFIGARLKPALLRAAGRIVVARADGVRLLFAEQLQNFARTRPSTIVREYFDMVPLHRFPPQPEQPYLLHVGFPYYLKGVDILLAAFERVREQFPHWRLMLIGYELDRHVPANLPQVTVMRAVPNREVAPWISRCSFLVLASRSEAMGRVLIEAAAAGKPRVASKIGGTYTVVSHDSDGLLVRTGDVDALADTLRRLMSDASLRQRLGASARERAMTEFSGERYLAHVSGLVGAVLERAGK